MQAVQIKYQEILQTVITLSTSRKKNVIFLHVWKKYELFNLLNEATPPLNNRMVWLCVLLPNID